MSDSIEAPDFMLPVGKNRKKENTRGRRRHTGNFRHMPEEQLQSHICRLEQPTVDFKNQSDNISVTSDLSVPLNTAPRYRTHGKRTNLDTVDVFLSKITQR